MQIKTAHIIRLHRLRVRVTPTGEVAAETPGRGAHHISNEAARDAERFRTATQQRR
jgi:hypothetical protein